MYVVFELIPAAPPTMAATLSTSSTRPMPGTWPSGVVKPACSVIAVAVPIVSKKSASMMVKMVSTAVRTPSVVKTWNRSNWPRVAKLGAWMSPCGGMLVTPTMKARMDVMMMLRTSAAGTLRT